MAHRLATTDLGQHWFLSAYRPATEAAADELRDADAVLLIHTDSRVAEASRRIRKALKGLWELAGGRI